MSDNAPIELQVITPEGAALTTPADSVSFPSAQGQLTILPGHQPIIGQTSAGELTYRNKSETKAYAIDNGFFMLKGEKLSLLVEGAADEAKISLANIESAAARAQEALKNSTKLDPAEVEEFERIVRFSIAQRLIKQKK